MFPVGHMLAGVAAAPADTSTINIDFQAFPFTDAHGHTVANGAIDHPTLDTSNHPAGSSASGLFTGSSQTLSITETFNFGGANLWTIEFDLYLPSLLVANAFVAAPIGDGSQLYLQTQAGVFYVGDGATNIVAVSMTGVLGMSAATWCKVKVTFDGSGTCKVYIDNVLKTTQTGTINSHAQTGFEIGGRESSGFFLAGNMANFKFWAGSVV